MRSWRAMTIYSQVNGSTLKEFTIMKAGTKKGNEIFFFSLMRLKKPRPNEYTYTLPILREKKTPYNSLLN